MTTQPSDWAVELLPCQFCGRAARRHTGRTKPVFYVACWPYGCGMLGPEKDTLTEAVTAWNTRAPVARELDSSGGGACAGDWVLVPRQLPDEASQLLAYFDMDSVGNNPHDAAGECWGHLIDMAAKVPTELKFSNPVFHAGTNLTVRRGLKWYREQWATVDVSGVKVIVRLSCMSHRFSLLTDHWVRDEHDPACRTVAGLLAEMQRVYPGFSENEEVTLVRFDLPYATPRAAEAGDLAKVKALPAAWRMRAKRKRIMGLASEARLDEAHAYELEAAMGTVGAGGGE